MSKATSRLILKQAYEDHADSLFAYGCRFTKDKELVKDCIHDLFVYIYEKDRLSQIQDFRSYLLRSFRNRLVQELSSASTQDVSESAGFQLWPDARSVEEEYIEQEHYLETDSFLKRAFSFLSQRQQEAVYLHYIEGMPYDAICELMGMNNQSVRNLIHRAMTKLRTKLDARELLMFLLFIAWAVNGKN